MIFPEFKGKVWGIVDELTGAWSADNSGVIFAGEQKDIIDIQCGACNALLPSPVIRGDKTFDKRFHVGLMADYSEDGIDAPT